MAPTTRRSANRSVVAKPRSVTRSANPAHKNAQRPQNAGQNVQLTSDINQQSSTPASTNMTAGKKPPSQHSTRPDTDLTIGSKWRAEEGITTRPSTPDHDTTSGQGIPIMRRKLTKRARIRGKPTFTEDR
jgi:hypothetical protein